MKTARRLAACGLAAIALGWSLPSPAAAQASEFKGLAAVSRELSSRIAPDADPIDLTAFLPADDMEALLGSWAGFGSERAFRNGAPNALNMVIWNVTLSRFAAAMGESCAVPRLAFHPRFYRTLQRICAWPARSARTEAVLLEYWLAMMGYAAPEGEFAAWRDYILANYGRKPAREAVAAMTLAIVMNPHFLLQE